MKTSRGLTTANFSIVAAMFILGFEVVLPAQTTSLSTTQTGKLQLVKTLPESGTFWSLQRPDYAPLPFVPEILGDVDVYYTGEGNTYIYNDVEFDYEAHQAKQAELAAESGALFSLEGESGGGNGPESLMFTTNDLWLEITGVDAAYAYLTLHGTMGGKSYQLLWHTNLSQPGEWNLGEIVYVWLDTNRTDLGWFWRVGQPQLFFRAHQADPVISLLQGDDAYEPIPAISDPGRSGFIQLYRPDASGDLTVYYRVSGTASNGEDYANLSGVITIQDGWNYTNIYIQPIADSLIEGVETVTVTLIQTNTYLIQPYSGYSETAQLKDSSTTVGISGMSSAVETNFASNIPGETGWFSLTRVDEKAQSQYPALTLQYAISGTASNGVDYAYLTGLVTFQAGETSTNIYVQTLPDNEIEGGETVKLTLVPSNLYVIDSNYDSATIPLLDNLASNTFVAVVTNLNFPIGIDYSPTANSLIVSVRGGFNYQPLDFVRLGTNNVGALTVTNWSGIANLPDDEAKLAIVSTGAALTNAAGFTNGDMFFSSSTGIGWLSADGTQSNLNWCVLTNSVQTNALPLRGGLYVDRSGVFSNQLVAVTSPGTGTAGNKGVWRVNAQGQPTFITNINTPHLEGVTTLPNTNLYGPWAGKIITGDEDFPSGPLIYSIGTNGVVTNYATATLFPSGIYPEDFDVIPPNQNLYACDPYANSIIKVSAAFFANFVGDLLVTDAGENAYPAKLFILHWDAATTNFMVRSASYSWPGGSGYLEHVTFAPIDLPGQ